MWNFLVEVITSAYAQVVLLFLLLAYFFGHRKDPRLMVSGLKLLQTAVLLIIFLYFVWNWASEIPPSLRATSVFGMFLINLHLAYNLLLSRKERQYRDALHQVGLEPQRPELLKEAWDAGKHFYHWAYFPSALFSGSSPSRVLHSLTSARVRDDLKDTLHHYGAEKKLVSLGLMADYLKSRLAADDTLPADFKIAMTQATEDFIRHPWIKEQVDAFLLVASESPEDLYFPDWLKDFDRTSQ